MVDDIKPDPAVSAREAGLRYLTDERPGIRREPTADGFRYLKPNGEPVMDPATLNRIRNLAIPPAAYQDVWISPVANSHLQATGRDARGRKQYRYHPDWRTVRDETKFDRMLAFARALPAIRERVDADLRRPGLPREKVLAAVVRLLETTFIRVGNEAYARENKSFGLTTLRHRHVELHGAKLTFHFRGKSGVQHEVAVTDRRLARVVAKCRELPGHELFQYVDDGGARQTVDSADVNGYLHDITGQPFTAKDFRTWAGTLLACAAFSNCEPCGTEREAKHQLVEVVRSVAARLGNTPSVCRKFYIHPAILQGHLDGTLTAALRAATDGEATAGEAAELFQLLGAGLPTVSGERPV